MQSVITTDAFEKAGEKYLTRTEYEALVVKLAIDPEAGALIRNSGALRKMRWARQSGGKSGGVRAIYYYHDARFPLLAIALYAKAGKDNLTDAELSTLRKLVDEYKKAMEE